MAGRGDLGFISLTGKVVKPIHMCWRPVIRAGLRSGAIRLDCGMSYANPVRARRRIAQAGPAPPPSRRLLWFRHVSPGAREFRRLRPAHPRDVAANVARIPPRPAEPLYRHADEQHARRGQRGPRVGMGHALRLLPATHLHRWPPPMVGGTFKQEDEARNRPRLRRPR